MKRIVSTIALIAIITVAYSQNLRLLTDTVDTPDIIIDEVIVKSPKEVPQVKDVPASIALISARTIENNEISSLTDISSTIPNFFMLDYGSKLQSSAFIRGIGSRLGTPSLGLYVDHVPYSEKTTFGFDFFDIERVEVLRGPQGTLYGRNTMGGIINVFSKSPLYYDETNVSVTAGSHEYYNVNVNHYNKVSDKFGYSVSGNYLKHNGYFTNEYSGDPADDKYSVSGRARLVWKLSEKTTLENIASYENSEQYGFPYASFDDATNTAGTINYDQESSYKRDLFSNGLVLKHKTDKTELTSTTSYMFYDGLMSVDQDYTANNFYFFNTGDKQNLLSQEVTFKSISPTNYKWICGAYGFYQTMDQLTTGVINSERNGQAIKIDQEISSGFTISGLALFHQSTIDNFLVDNLSLTAGIRLDYEKDKLDYLFNRWMNGTQITNTVEDYEETFVELLPKVALKYSFNKGVNTYATVSKGYKSGGFNTNSAVILENRSYDPEQSWNYELGMKSSFANNHLHIDAALFYIDWKDQQIDVPVPNGQGNMKINAGESVSKGFELFVRALPFKNFETTLSYGYSKANFTDYEVEKAVTDDDGNIIDYITIAEYTDNYIPYVPRSTFNFGVNKTFEFKNSFLDKMVANATYRRVGKHFWNLDNSVFQDAYGIFDAKLSFKSGKVQFDIWGKNLFDTSYNSYYFVITSLPKSFVQLGKPASFGVNLKVTF